jgi:hypothetical protein
MKEKPMPNDLPQNLWQDQPTEEFAMTLNEVRRKAEAFHKKTRLRVLTMMIIGLALLVVFSRSSIREPHSMPRAAWALLALGSAIMAVQSYRWQWPRNRAFDSAETGLRAYRQELKKHRDYSSRIWRLSGLPVVFLGVALLVVPPLLANPAAASKAVPFFALLVIWFAIFIPQRRRQERQLQRDIDELNALERDAQ